MKHPNKMFFFSADTSGVQWHKKLTNTKRKDNSNL